MPLSWLDVAHQWIAAYSGCCAPPPIPPAVAAAAQSLHWSDRSAGQIFIRNTPLNAHIQQLAPPSQNVVNLHFVADNAFLRSAPVSNGLVNLNQLVDNLRPVNWQLLQYLSHLRLIRIARPTRSWRLLEVPGYGRHIHPHCQFQTQLRRLKCRFCRRLGPACRNIYRQLGLDWRSENSPFSRRASLSSSTNPY